MLGLLPNAGGILSQLSKLKTGDLVVYTSGLDQSKRFGIITYVSKAGACKIRWNDGIVNVFGSSGIIDDNQHEIYHC